MGGGPKRRKKSSPGLKRLLKTKRKTKDLDQIDDDLKEENIHKLLHQEVDPDLPGDAQHYCVHCARYFINREALKSHFKSKPHKKRLKSLELEPYTIEESERAGGLGSYIPPKKRKIETQPMDDETFDPAKEDVDMK
ncbi:zinc finger protein 593-like [Penaeus monodon]|uniref:zinc finger protein 593-like n=1 Tax=Penaeus monodon TaxID=6687 RepID=UPI0018A79974|nr:zinc finger protein 593-like [Penaeus monodon]